MRGNLLSDVPPVTSKAVDLKYKSLLTLILKDIICGKTSNKPNDTLSLRRKQDELMTSQRLLSVSQDITCLLIQSSK